MKKESFTELSKKESIFFDFLKLFLLTEVIIGHSLALYLPSLNTLNYNSVSIYLLAAFRMVFSFGRESAYLFIFLSGFFTASSFTARGLEQGLFHHIFKRIRRIYPVFSIALLITLFLDYLGIYFFKFPCYFSNGLNFDVRDFFTLQVFLKNFFSLQPTFSPSFGSNGPLWTLGYLMQFFIVMIILKALAKRNQIILIMSALIVSIVSCFSDVEFGLLFIVWCVGLVCRNIFLPVYRNKTVIILILTVILLFVSKIGTEYVAIALSPLVGILFLLLGKAINLKRAFEFLSKLFPLPDVSYTLYAIHMPVLFFTYGMFANIFGKQLSIITYLIFLIWSILIIFGLTKLILLIVPKKR